MLLCSLQLVMTIEFLLKLGTRGRSGSIKVLTSLGMIFSQCQMKLCGEIPRYALAQMWGNPTVQLD